LIRQPAVSGCSSGARYRFTTRPTGDGGTCQNPHQLVKMDVHPLKDMVIGNNTSPTYPQYIQAKPRYGIVIGCYR